MLIKSILQERRNIFLRVEGDSDKWKAPIRTWKCGLGAELLKFCSVGYRLQENPFLEYHIQERVKCVLPYTGCTTHPLYDIAPY